jgi:hypothetical protein
MSLALKPSQTVPAPEAALRRLQLVKAPARARPVEQESSPLVDAIVQYLDSLK